MVTVPKKPTYPELVWAPPKLVALVPESPALFPQYSNEINRFKMTKSKHAQ